MEAKLKKLPPPQIKSRLWYSGEHLVHQLIFNVMQCRKSKFVIEAIKHCGLTLWADAAVWQVKQLRASGKALAAGKDLSPFACVSTTSMFVLPPNSFSHSPPLCLISLSLSSPAPACPRDSEPLNIHPFSSIAPTVLFGGGKKMALNYSGPNQGYFGRLARLRWGGTNVCVFWCAVSVNSMSTLSCHNHRHYTTMLGSSNALLRTEISPHGCMAERLQ